MPSMRGRSSEQIESVDGKPVLSFGTSSAFATWLKKHSADSSGIWLRLAKKGTGVKSVSYDEALNVALCYGWIDGQSRGENETYYRQKFTPRGKRSTWSKRNRELVAALIASGEMQPPGQAEIDRAKADGRWDAAYDSPANITVPGDFQAALRKNKRAREFFETLDRRNRFAILHQLQIAKKPETRERKIREFVRLLSRSRTED